MSGESLCSGSRMDDGVRILREAEFWARIWRESSFVFISNAATSGEKVIKETATAASLAEWHSFRSVAGDFDRPKQKYVGHFPHGRHTKKNTEASHALLLFPLPCSNLLLQIHFLCTDEELQKGGPSKAALSGWQGEKEEGVHKKTEEPGLIGRDFIYIPRSFSHSPYQRHPQLSTLCALEPRKPVTFVTNCYLKTKPCTAAGTSWFWAPRGDTPPALFDPTSGQDTSPNSAEIGWDELAAQINQYQGIFSLSTSLGTNTLLFMEGVPSPSSGTFVSLLLFSPLPSLSMHSWYLIPHCQGYSCCFQPLLFIPDLTPSSWDELQWPQLPDLAGLSSSHGKCWHSAPLSCRCCDTTCSHISKTLSTIILKAILFQIRNHRNKGDWKSTVGWARLFFWESQMSKLVYSKLLKPFPCYALPLYIQTFSLCSSSGQTSNSQFFLPEVAAEAASSQEAPWCPCSSHMLPSCLEVSVLALAPH